MPEKLEYRCAICESKRTEAETRLEEVQKYMKEHPELMEEVFDADQNEIRDAKLQEEKELQNEVNKYEKQRLVERVKNLTGTPPECLTIHLKRFKPDFVLRRYVKRKDEVIIPKNLDLAPMISNELRQTLRQEADAKKDAGGEVAKVDESSIFDPVKDSSGKGSGSSSSSAGFGNNTMAAEIFKGINSNQQAARKNFPAAKNSKPSVPNASSNNNNRVLSRQQTGGEIYRQVMAASEASAKEEEERRKKREKEEAELDEEMRKVIAMSMAEAGGENAGISMAVEDQGNNDASNPDGSPDAGQELANFDDTEKDKSAEKIIGDPVSLLYELAAIICHQGESPTSGHYTAFIRNFDADAWVFWDDSTSSDCFTLPNSVKTSAYVLQYRRKQ
jgi:hypothetical protein